jgi:HlyD family secretion protein
VAWKNRTDRPRSTTVIVAVLTSRARDTPAFAIAHPQGAGTVAADQAGRRRALQNEIRKLYWFAAGLFIAAVVVWRVGDVFHHADVQVTTAVVDAGPIVRHIVATGTLQAVRTVDVGAQVSDTIQSLDADYNSIVRKGQVLAKLDPSLIDAQLQEARAAEQQAEASVLASRTAVDDAATKLDRAETLGAKGLIQQSDLDAARIAKQSADADLKAAEAQVVEAHANVAQAAVNLEHTIIQSPIDGIVIARNVDVGQTVAAAFQAPVLFTIATDLTRMQVEVDIDESDVGAVQPGTPVTFQVESYPHETFEGSVAQVRLQPVAEMTTTATAVGGGSTASASTTAVGTVIGYATMIDVANADEKLRPGMTATVTLTGLRREHAVRIPNSALSFRPAPAVLSAVRETAGQVPAAQSRVWRFDGKQFTPVDVRVGLADNEWSELVSGPLHPGDAVVTEASIR